jgi:signal transduction histidine kinase
VAPESLLDEDDDPLELLGLVLHELRNPLGIAVGHLELARDDCDSDHLDSVARALDRMDSLVDDFGAITANGRIIEELQSVELQRVVEDSWKNVTSERASVVVDATCRIRADPDRLQQVMENLLRNAVEHGGGDVAITIGELAEGSGFFVEDDGSGIPAEDRETVFERGYTGCSDGTGFGLWIVDNFVAAHGWTITVSEGSTGGTRFEIRDVDVVQ